MTGADAAMVAAAAVVNGNRPPLIISNVHARWVRWGTNWNDNVFYSL